MHQRLKSCCRALCQIMTSSLPSRGFILLSHLRSVSRIQPLRRSFVGSSFPRPVLWRSFKSCVCLRFPQLPPSKVKDDFRGEKPAPEKSTIRENIYTIPNFLTLSRILACPVLGWSILHNDFYLATGLLVYAGLSDTVSQDKACSFNLPMARSSTGTWPGDSICILSWGPS